MADWQEGMAYLMGEQGRRRGEDRADLLAQLQDPQQRLLYQFDHWTPEQQRAYAAAFRTSPERAREMIVSGQIKPDAGSFSVGVSQGRPTVGVGGIEFSGPEMFGASPPASSMAMPSTAPGFQPPSTRDMSMGAMRGRSGMAAPGGAVSPFNPTPPAVRYGAFEEPEWATPGSGFRGLDIGAGGTPGAPMPPSGGAPPSGQPRRGGIGGFISENQELIGSVLGTAADVYGAHQEGKGREAELEERRRQHQAEMEERRKEREQDRIRMAMQGIAAFA